MLSPARRMGLWACVLALCASARVVPGLLSHLPFMTSPASSPPIPDCTAWVVLLGPQGSVVGCGDGLLGPALPELSHGDGIWALVPPVRLPQAMADTTRLAMGLPIDVNYAQADVLATVPGISPRLAGTLVAHRTAHGCFAALDDLTQVRGLGAATLRRIRPYFFVTPTALANPHGPLL